MISPILYLPHGGGPLPVLGDVHHASLVTFLKAIPQQLGNPKAIIIISAHWEEDVATITASTTPGMIYDYYGFPPESYQLSYPAPGNPVLAQQTLEALEAADIPVRLDAKRGFDHGLYIPLMLMYPDANIPCIQLSLHTNLDARTHIELGKALQALRQEDLLIIGSGMSFHNMQAFRAGEAAKDKANQFNNWLIDTCSSAGLSPQKRGTRLIAWQEAPHAHFCHPREEHLLPLQVCFGASGGTQAKTVFNGDVLQQPVSAFLWH